ncbi:MAG TPA: RNase adapter RapZ [Gemmatimonadota bacterium]|nr:RNase adapter RapZ [Gemmatimonadota bacterium]
MHEPLIRLFQEHAGERPAAVVRVAADGSQRAYHRLVGPDGRTAIGAVGPDRDENRAFLSYSRAFRGVGLPVPEIYAADEASGAWLMEDLGDLTLFDALQAARTRDGTGFPESTIAIYRLVVETLPRFQIEGHAVADYSVAYPRAAFDRQSILWDLNYFKYHFLKLAHVPFSEEGLERDFRRLAAFLLKAESDSFLYRDFQSRNIMLQDGEPWFIDYQGGRRGALQYDLASLLYDSKAAIPEHVRGVLFDHYLDALAGYARVDREEFLDLYRGYVLVRIMQAMGAYGYRGFFERKPRFLESVPYAADNIRGLLAAGLPIRLPEIETTFHRIVEEWAHAPGEPGAEPGLTVHVQSFSYKRGYPQDTGGHGGGFVFDCRALLNPGRLPEFETMCGRDAGVVEWIESHTEVAPYWENIQALSEAQVEAYLAREFTSLSIAFGCTGGRHRSVYLAERLARHLAERFPQIQVRLVHHEEPHWAGEIGRAAASAPVSVR